MIDKLSYEQIEEIVKSFREQKDTIKKLSRGRGVPELDEFLESVESYCKFLENSIELNRAADLALKDLVK